MTLECESLSDLPHRRCRPLPPRGGQDLILQGMGTGAGVREDTGDAVLDGDRAESVSYFNSKFTVRHKCEDLE